MSITINLRRGWTLFSTIYFIIVAFLILYTPMLPLLMMLGYSVICYFIYPVRHWRYFPVIFLMINNCMGTTTVLWLDYRKWFILVLVTMFFVDLIILKKSYVGCFFWNKYFVSFYVLIILIDILSGGTYTIFSLFFEFICLSMTLYEISREDQLQDFIDMLIIANLIIALIGLYELSIEDTFYYKRWTGENRYRNGIMRMGSTVEDPNFMCFSMVPTLPFLYYKAQTTKRKLYYRFIQIIFCVVIVLTMSRIGLLTMLLGYMLIYFNKIEEILKKNKVLLVYIAFIAMIIGGAVLIFISSKLSFNMSDDSFSGRLYVYLSALQLVVTHPIFGLGFEKFAAAVEVILMKQYGMYNAIGFQNPMNTWLQVAIDGGMVALIPFVMFFVRNFHLSMELRKMIPRYNELLKMVGIAILQWLIISFTLDGMESAMMWYTMLIPIMIKKIFVRERKKEER